MASPEFKTTFNIDKNYYKNPQMMQTPKTKVLNVNKLHHHTCINLNRKWELLNKIHSLRQPNTHPQEYEQQNARRIPTSTHQQSPVQQLTSPNWKVYFEKRGELMFSRKINNLFLKPFLLGEEKLHACLVIYMHNFQK